MNEALILALVFAALLFAGVPIAFAIGSAAVAALLMSLDPAAATTVIAQRMATGLDSFALLAIPFFILSGQLMNRGGIARRLIDLAKVIVGRLPGGLAYVNILGSMLFGSISGSAVAAAAAIGGTMTPMMKREGYNREFAAAVNISAATTAIVLLLVGTSMGMSWVMSSANIPQAITATILSITENPILLLLIINALLLVVGCFMDMTPAVLIFTPILLPIVQKFGMSPLHFGLVLIFNLCIGLCTPPVGSCLFVGCGVAGTTIAKVWRPLLPFFFAMFAVLMAVTYWPALSLALPHALGFK